MRVGLVRNVALGTVALVGLGLAGCDDNPTDFDRDSTEKLVANPTVMTVPAGVTTLLESRTENAGNEPTWEEVTATVDGTCGSGSVIVDVAATYEPTIQPPGQFDVTGGTSLGETCIVLTGGGQTTIVEVTVVGDSLQITGAPDSLALFETVQLSAAAFADDGTPVTPFDPLTDVTWESDDEDVMTVDNTGLVTAVGGVGSATITATWVHSGVTQTSSVTISTNQPTLAITGGLTIGDSLLIDTAVDLGVTLTNPTDPPFDFGAFDPDTDVTWSSSDDDVVSVDPMTGVATAVGFGTATITVSWNPAPDVTATTDIPVSIPAPTLTSASQASADLGDLITLTGAGFHPAMTILVDGAEMDAFYEPTIVDATTATFHFPFGSTAGDVDVQVGAPGELSSAQVITRTAINDPGEPNDTYGGAFSIGAAPVDIWGVVDGVDATDRFRFTLAADATVALFMDWIGASGDLDLLILDATPTAFECTGTATGAHPEEDDCDLTAGEHIIRVDSYDHLFGIYRVTITP